MGSQPLRTGVTVIACLQHSEIADMLLQVEMKFVRVCANVHQSRAHRQKRKDAAARIMPACRPVRQVLQMASHAHMMLTAA